MTGDGDWAVLGFWIQLAAPTSVGHRVVFGGGKHAVARSVVPRNGTARGSPYAMGIASDRI